MTIVYHPQAWLSVMPKDAKFYATRELCLQHNPGLHETEVVETPYLGDINEVVSTPPAVDETPAPEAPAPVAIEQAPTAPAPKSSTSKKKATAKTSS